MLRKKCGARSARIVSTVPSRPPSTLCSVRDMPGWMWTAFTAVPTLIPARRARRVNSYSSPQMNISRFTLPIRSNTVRPISVPLNGAMVPGTSPSTARATRVSGSRMPCMGKARVERSSAARTSGPTMSSPCRSAWASSSARAPGCGMPSSSVLQTQRHPRPSAVPNAV